MDSVVLKICNYILHNMAFKYIFLIRYEKCRKKILSSSDVVLVGVEIVGCDAIRCSVSINKR